MKQEDSIRLNTGLFAIQVNKEPVVEPQSPDCLNTGLLFLNIEWLLALREELDWKKH